VVFDHCDNIRLEGVTITNSPNWHVVPYYSHHIIIRNVKILAPAHSPNTDAIDPFASSDIRIDHVTADVGDDNVAIKSGEPGSPGPDEPSENINITDCTFLHGHGLSVGSEVAGGVRHVHVSRVHFEGTNTGIRIKSGRDRGNDLSDLVYRDLTMNGVHTAIQITDYYGDKSRLGAAGVQPAPVSRLTPHMHNITIKNLKAAGVATAMDIEGLPEAPITKLTLQNVSIESDTGAKVFYADIRSHDLRISSRSGPPVVMEAGAHDSGK
jgi:polygalacturonase